MKNVYIFFIIIHALNYLTLITEPLKNILRTNNNINNNFKEFNRKTAAVPACFFKQQQ